MEVDITPELVASVHHHEGRDLVPLHGLDSGRQREVFVDAFGTSGHDGVDGLLVFVSAAADQPPQVAVGEDPQQGPGGLSPEQTPCSSRP